MRLKSLELHGYKTFASRTLFEFSGAVTCIVGPNGSGKSNIADSLRWVLGEQSYSLLRGKKTEDMIFAGSEGRPRAGMASATVTFDNAGGWLPIDFSEVAITRRAYRDGQNEYLVNGQRVRLKDVSELLAQSGLAERTYTIIGQGVVDAALALKAEERRRLFEEAAGIGLHRARREEALRRLETTRRNLERVQDILAELGPRLRSLERQARRAQEFEQVRDDLRLMLHEWYGYHWHQAQAELREAREQARRLSADLEKAQSQASASDELAAAARGRINGLRLRLNAWHRQLAALHTRREELSRQRAVEEERLRLLADQQVEARSGQSRLEEELALAEERLSLAAEQAAQLEAELADARLQAEAARQALQTRLRERQDAESALQSARQRQGSLNARRGELLARLGERKSQAGRHASQIEDAAQAVQAAELEQQNAQKLLAEAAEAFQSASVGRQSALQTLEAARQELSRLEEQRKALRDEGSALQARQARLQAQLEVLEQAERSLAGYAAGAQALLRAAAEQRLPGARGALSSRLETPPELEAAIAAALGEYLDALVLDGDRAVDSALDLIAGQPARAALLPLDALAPPAALQADAVRRLGLEGLLGIASDLVSAPPELRPALDLLLGRTLVARDRASARRALRRLSAETPGLRAVTLQGEIFAASGPVIAGQEGRTAALSRPRQRRELAGDLARLGAELESHQERLQAHETALSSRQADVERLAQSEREARQAEDRLRSAHSQAEAAANQAARQVRFHAEQRQRLLAEQERLQTETGQMSRDLQELETELEAAHAEYRSRQEALAALSLEEAQAAAAHWNTQAAVAERAAADGRARLSERQAAVEAARRELSALGSRLLALETAAAELQSSKGAQREEETALASQIDELQRLIDPAEAELQAEEQAQEELLATEGSARSAVSKAEHNHAQARINLARKQESVETWRRRIEDDFGLVAFEYSEEVSGPTPLPLGGLVEQLPRIQQISPDLEENLRRQRAQLRRMGPVNPEAQAEYREVKERYEFMTAQVSDLTQAEQDVRQVIAELDALMQKELRRTFDLVAEEFSAIFKRLFGGGSARLLLTDPDDMTSTGIEIEARLPGRRTQGLSLLSGGERSLTAGALVFALLKVSPTPFCLLDEMDAMLDEANVGRFRELLRELSQTTQFIVVTHNRNTVQAADVIYGITMGRDSASQVISLKLDEVEKIVE